MIYHLFLVTMLVFGALEPAEEPSLFISESLKKTSKYSLKEDVGRSVKEVLQQSTKTLESLASQMKDIKIAKSTNQGAKQIEEIFTLMGSMISRIASIQKTLFERIEQLMDNALPFKKATRDELREAIGILQETARYLEKMRTEFEKTASIALSKRIVEQNKMLAGSDTTFSALFKRFNASVCLGCVA